MSWELIVAVLATIPFALSVTMLAVLAFAIIRTRKSGGNNEKDTVGKTGQ